MVIRWAGNVKPELIMALRTLSRASDMLRCGKPTRLNAGNPADICTSMVINGASIPNALRA